MYFASNELMYHNKHSGRQLALDMMKSYIGIPNDIQKYIDFSMITQAEGLKFGLEHYRSRKYNCAGALIWQLNDCWPGITWSLVDYYLMPKASYYHVKRAFQPVIIVPKNENGNLEVTIVNDLNKKIKGILEAALISYNGKLANAQSFSINISADSTIKLDLGELSKIKPQNEHCLIFKLFDDKGLEIARNLFFFVDPKEDYFPKANIKLKVSDNKIQITSDNFARFVHVHIKNEQIIFSDNWFDLLPNETKIITANSKNKINPKQIEILGLNISKDWIGFQKKKRGK